MSWEEDGERIAMRFVRDREEWNRLVKGFPDWDVYYLYEYARSLEIHGEGMPVLLYWKGTKMELCYVIMLQDIAGFGGFFGSLVEKEYFDMTTPYGYGGPLVKGEISEGELSRFVKDLTEECNKRKISAKV